MNTTRYLFKYFYIGSEGYHGSQRQEGLETVEDCLINALILKGYIKDAPSSGFEVASRTDKLVSARGAVFSCKMERPPILMEINSALPRDIGIWAFTEVPETFLSRYNAIYRHYRYLLLVHYYENQSKQKLSLKPIKKACELTSGHHDFTNFSKKSSENDEKTIRDLNLSVFKEGPFLIFDFKSRAYLRQQIRKIMAKIIEVGKNEISLKQYSELLDPTKEFSFSPADPDGLILWDIHYGEDVKFIQDPKSIERMRKYLIKNYVIHKTSTKLFHLFQQDYSS